MALIALVIGTSFTVAATERVTLSLVLAGAIGWSFVPVMQLLTGLLLVRGSGRPRLDMLERYFGTHWPWSLWILSVHATLLIAPVARTFGLWLVLTAAVPVIWTVRLLVAFCRDDLGLDGRQGRRKVVLHQGATCLLFLVYVSFAVALWPRIIGIMG